MKFLTSKAFAASVIGVVALIGCGGGGGGGGSTPTTVTELTIPSNGVVAFITEVQASSSDSTEPRDISTLNLAADDTAEPDAI